MAIDLQRLINSRIGIRLVGILARTVPPRLGYACADFIADRIFSRKKSRIVRAVRANQRVVRGEGVREEDLEQAVGEVFQNSARSIFELYRGIQYPQEAWESIVMDPSAGFLLRRPEYDARGLVVVSLHLGNFDLVLHTLSRRGIRPLVLTIPDPRGGRFLEFQSRKNSGANMLPGSFGAIRKALRHLQRGGYVATGIDRPISQSRLRPRFFGRPAALPLHHIFLAIQARVPVSVLATIRRPDGKHLVFASPEIEMEPHPDRETEILLNGERVLRTAEEFIRRAPAQWSESLPVWPETMDRDPISAR
jgi:lauroyl/myristoyl acyltransferase